MNPRSLIRMSATVYAVMAALGIGWAWFCGRANVTAHPSPWLSLDPWAAHAVSIGLGLALAALTVGFTRWAHHRYEWAKRLHAGFREIVGALPGRAVVLLALTSSLGEEVFFRGGLQPSLGWLATSALFGLMHFPRDRRFLAWTPWALLIGLALGAIHEATGSLLGAWLAHFGLRLARLNC